MLCNNCGKESAGCWSKCPNCGAEKLPNSEEEEDGVKRQNSIQSYCEWKWLEECDVPKEEMEGNIFLVISESLENCLLNLILFFVIPAVIAVELVQNLLKQLDVLENNHFWYRILQLFLTRQKGHLDVSMSHCPIEEVWKDKDTGGDNYEIVWGRLNIMS